MEGFPGYSPQRNSIQFDVPRFPTTESYPILPVAGHAHHHQHSHQPLGTLVDNEQVSSEVYFLFLFS